MVKVRPVRVDDLTVTPSGERRRLGLAAVALPAALALTGCAGGPAAVADQPARPAHPRAAAATASPAGPAPASATLPAPCSLVDASDVSLYVALSSWEVTSTEQDGRSVCRFTTDGFTVTTVTMRLADPADPPAGLCLPPGSTATRPAKDLLCGYTGPGADTSTSVAAGSEIAVGVRVAGPGAAGHAAVLAQHALTHL